MENSPRELKRKYAIPVSIVLAIVLWIISSWSDILEIVSGKDDGPRYIAIARAAVQFVFSTTICLIAGYAYELLRKIDLILGQFVGFFESLEGNGSILHRRNPRNVYEPSYVLACEPWHETLPDTPSGIDPKSTKLFSILRARHGDFQNLLLSEKYLPWMITARKAVNAQDRVIIIPDRLRHTIVPNAFWALSDSIEITSHAYSKSEFYNALAKISSSGFDRKKWEQAKNLSGSTSCFQKSISKAREYLNGSPNLFVTSTNCHTSNNSKITALLPSEVNGVKWIIQHEIDGRLQTDLTITSYNHLSEAHVGAMIAFAFILIACNGKRKSKDVVEDIADVKTTRTLNPLGVSFTQNLLEEIAKFE